MLCVCWATQFWLGLLDECLAALSFLVVLSFEAYRRAERYLSVCEMISTASSLADDGSARGVALSLSFRGFSTDSEDFRGTARATHGSVLENLAKIFYLTKLSLPPPLHKTKPINRHTLRRVAP